MVDENMRALSIRQPHAEAVLRGEKVIEYRSRATKIRGRFYIYAGGKVEDDYDWWMDFYGIDDVAYADLPRGVVVGTAELYDCSSEPDEDGYYHWCLCNPEPVKELLKPLGQAQPAWFYPFRKR